MKSIRLIVNSWIFIVSIGYIFANSPVSETQIETINSSKNTIKFEQNRGQMSSKVSYGFMTTFGSMYIEQNKLKLSVLQCDPLDDIASHSLEITFPGSNDSFNIEALNELPAKYNYFPDNSLDKTITDVPVYGELNFKNVYEGIDLRLYSTANKTIEFDWVISAGADFSKIKIHFEGQDNLIKNKSNNLEIGLRYNNIEMQIPECYQIINNEKKRINMDFSFLDNKTIGYHLNELACSNELDKNFPLIIDPSIIWSSYFDLDDNIFPVFDAYCSGVEIVPCTGESYIIGTSNLSVPIGYRDNAIGYDNTAPVVNNRKGIIYKIDPTGSVCQAFTYFGNNVTIKSIGLFPNGNVIIGGSIDSTCDDGSSCITMFGSVPLMNPFSNTGRGWVAVFNSSLNTLIYSTQVPGLSGNFGARAWARGGITSISVLDDNNYFVGGVCNSNITNGGTSGGANFVPTIGVPDATASGYESYIARFSGANYNNKDWATFFGASGNEDIVDIDITTDKTKIVFCTSTTNAINAPALINPIDTTRNNMEGLIGVLPINIIPPSAFLMYSYLGGGGDESGFTIALDSNYLYTYYTTTTSHLSANQLPGGVSGSFDSTYNGTMDGAITKALITGGFNGRKSTYVGGNNIDKAGCIAINKSVGDLYLFGTTLSPDFPCINTVPPASYFDNTLGSTGFYDISIAFITGDLKNEKYGIYIGGCWDDYLGETGTIHSGDHLSYNYSLSRLGLATTIHSADMATYGTNCAIGLTAPLNNNIGKFDANKTTGREGDAHFIVLFQPTPDGDYGDVPRIYETNDPAVNKVIPELRFGLLNEADRNPLSSTYADGDDIIAMTNPCGGGGIPDDEDGIDTSLLPLSFTYDISTFTVPINCINNTNSTAVVHAWIDINRDSIFEVTEYSTAAIPAGFNRDTMLNWDLSTFLCGNTINTGLSYIRFRITTQPVIDNNTTSIDERSISYQSDGEVEDYIIYIRGTDWGDLPNPYPLASAVSFLDINNDFVPDENNGGREYPVWLGTKVDVECIAHQNSSATADLYDDGLILPFVDSISANQNYIYKIALNSTQIGKPISYGIWFDWNFNGNFTDPVDGFYSDSALNNSPVIVPVNVSTPATLGTLYALRIIASGNGPIIQSDYNVKGKRNGEVEDYIIPTKDFVLGIELLNFDGKFNQNYNHIYWTANSESDGLVYILQRSTDGIHYDDISNFSVLSNSNLSNNYSYNDYDINSSSAFYYRIKIVERDYSYYYSKSIIIRIQNNNQFINIYPNPNSGEMLYINFSNYAETEFNIILTNDIGEIFENHNYRIIKNSETIPIQTKMLSTGIYYIKISGIDTHTILYTKEIIVSSNERR